MTLVRFEDVDLASIGAWCENALAILDVLRRQPEKLPFRIPIETLLELETIVDGWRLEAAGGRSPSPREYSSDELRQLIVYWFNITKLTSADRDRLGITFTPPAGRAFADALAMAVGAAIACTPELSGFADRLESEWQACQPGFAVGRSSRVVL